MQTFLPYANFESVARCLDRARLQKQILECKQIFLSLTVPTYGWKSHPAVQQWKGHEGCLLHYMDHMIKEFQRRGFAPMLRDWLETNRRLCSQHSFMAPTWLGREEVHSSHRASLLSKNLEHYGRFNWPELPRAGYVWAIPNGSSYVLKDLRK